MCKIQFHRLDMQLTVFECLLRTIPSVTGPLLQAMVDSVICFGGAMKHLTSFWPAKHSRILRAHRYSLRPPEKISLMYIHLWIVSGFYIAALASDNDNFPSRILLMLAGNGVGMSRKLYLRLGQAIFDKNKILRKRESDSPIPLPLSCRSDYIDLTHLLNWKHSGIYYALQIFLELGLAAATAYASYRYGTSSVELMEAIRKLAGPVAGLNLADKAANVVNMVKVLNALEEVSRLLQVC